MTRGSLPARGDAVALARALVAIDSRNPSLVAGAPGERAAADLLARTLDSWGLDVTLADAVPGRPNVVAKTRGGESARTLLLNGHLDVVGVDGMTHAPFEPQERSGLLFGRGAADMKGGVAAMCAAAARAAGTGANTIVAAVVDEEYESLGTRALVASGIRADAAIVTEPTRLEINPAHRGFVWLELTFRGRAAHGSRYDIGRDAITDAGLLLTELEELDRSELPRRMHSLLGRGSVHASTIAGGSGLSTYPESCVLRVERRTLPGETKQQVVNEIEAALERVRARRPALDATIAVVGAQEPSDVPADSEVVRALCGALRGEGIEPRVSGMSAWTDAAIFNAAGIPAICFGPGDIMLAHAAEEYVPVAEIEQATSVLERVIREWGTA